MTMSGAGPIAVIDVGSNSTNCLAVGADGRILERTIVSTRLGTGLHSSGILSTEGIERTAEAVSRHVRNARAAGIERIEVVGTAACRRATNTADLAGRLATETGLALEVLSPADEARHAFSGAMVGLPEELVPTLVIDIGGGSTEYVVGVGEPDAVASIPFGAVVSTEAFFDTDPPRPEDLTNLIGAVSDEIEELGRTMPAISAPGRVVGVAGTIVTIAAVELGLAEFDHGVLHGMVLTKDAAEDVFRTVATEPLAQRRLNPGLPEDRADIIVAGCCILVATMRRLQLDRIVVSTGGLLEGVALRGRLSR